MCSIQHIGNMFVYEGQNHRYAHVFSNMVVNAIQSLGIRCILKICYDPIWGLVTNKNVYLNISLYEVLSVDHKMEMPGTELLHITFPPMCVAHIFCVGNDSHANYTSIFWHVLYPYHYSTSHVTMLGLKHFFEIPLLN